MNSIRPAPSIDIQGKIVACPERERGIFEGNRELIRLYEEKAKRVVEKVGKGDWLNETKK